MAIKKIPTEEKKRKENFVLKIILFVFFYRILYEFFVLSFFIAPSKLQPQFFGYIFERNNGYSDTLDFRRGRMGEVGLVMFFILEGTGAP